MFDRKFEINVFNAQSKHFQTNICGVQQGVKSLMRSLKAKYKFQLQREFERPYMRGKYVSTAHTPISLGTIGKLVGILYTLSYSRHVC